MRHGMLVQVRPVTKLLSAAIPNNLQSTRSVLNVAYLCYNRLLLSIIDKPY
jgi:hypothetical protein